MIRSRWCAYWRRNLDTLLDNTDPIDIFGLTGYPCRRINAHNQVEYYVAKGDLLSEIYPFHIALDRWYTDAPIASFYVTLEAFDESFLHEGIHQLIMRDKLWVEDEESKVRKMAIKLSAITAGRWS